MDESLCDLKKVKTFQLWFEKKKQKKKKKIILAMQSLKRKKKTFA